MIPIQKTYQKIRKHLLKQNTKSYDDGICRYYTRNEETGEECRCAIGCLISKKQYKEDMEGYDIYELYNFYPKLLEKYVGTTKAKTRTIDLNLEVLSTLQWVHDKLEPHDWPNVLPKDFKKFKEIYHIMKR